MKAGVIFDLNVLEKNVAKLLKETKNITYIFPVKCCNNSDVLDLVNKYEFGFDISNKNELKLIEKYLDNCFLSVSGPLSYELKDYNYSNKHIIANNLGSFEKGMGLRINFNSHKEFDFSRFGEDYKLLDRDIKINIEYIHFHNSDHRTKAKCQLICEEFRELLYDFPNLKYLNIGGHLEDLSLEEGIEYLKIIREIVPKHVTLIVEVGDYLFKNVGHLYCNVIDVRRDNDKQIVTLNFSKMANQRWVYPKYSEEMNKDTIPTIFYGCSCCETDTYLETNARPLICGEQVIFSNISPYSYQWDKEFNGVEKMEFIFKK